MIANTNQLHNNYTDKENSLALIEDAENLATYRMQPLVSLGHWTETCHLENPDLAETKQKHHRLTILVTWPNRGPEMEETINCLENYLLPVVLIVITRVQRTCWAVDGRQGFSVGECVCFTELGRRCVEDLNQRQVMTLSWTMTGLEICTTG